MKKLFFAFITGLLLLALIGSYFQRQALACELLPVMGLQQIDDQVYIESDIASERMGDLSKQVSSASQRITDVYGTPESKPRILITSNANTAAKWGANDTASMHRLPWGSCIIVGPKGQNIDVIAHEWLHAEIQHRVGFWRFMTEIPIWFDEGAALTLDYREPYLPKNINLSDEDVLAVHSLTKGREFFAGDIRSNYQAARMAVVPIIRNENFFDDLERIAKGESFEAVFLND